MSFADELRKVDLPKKSPKQIQFEKRVQGMLYAVRSFCMARKENRNAVGYILFSDEREYCQEWYTAFESLTKPYVRELDTSNYCRLPKKGDRIDAFVKDKSACCDRTIPIAEDISTCKQYAIALNKLLNKDGFSDISLLVVPVFYVYDEVKMKSGWFNCIYWKERVTTNDIIGYTIKFSVSW